LDKIKQILKPLFKPAIAMGAAFAIGGVLLVLAGYDVSTAFKALWDASFKNLRSFTVTINRSSPIIFTGLAIAIAFRANAMNMGAEGQFLFGAIGATWVGLTFTTLPGFILIPLMIIVGAAFGAFWALIPAFLKIKYEVSEIITTIMFNYVALHFIGFLVRGPWRDTGQAEPQSFPIATQGFLPELLPKTRLHFGYFLGILMAIGLFYLLFKTYIGYEIRAVGLNKDAARTAGISAEKTLLGTMLLSGALAGMGGAIELGSLHYLIEGISPGHGWTGIAVSVLATNNPLGIIFTSFLFGALSSGATSMQRAAGVSASFVQIFQGIMIIGIALATLQTMKKSPKKEVKQELKQGLKKEGVA
jgi:simple sugar transport system permease protein